MDTQSEAILALRPVTFRYKQADEKGQKPEQYGLIAEEVAKVMRGRALVDLRNVYDRGDAAAAGLAYHGVGRGRPEPV